MTNPDYRQLYIDLTKALLQIRKCENCYSETVEDLFNDNLDSIYYKCLSADDRKFIREYDFGPG